MKGIIIAGGKGTRLCPLTNVISKPLLPVYDKPMIYYPLAILMEAGIKEILIITTPEDKHRFMNLLGDGSQLGISIKFKVEPSPKGIAQAFIIGEEFIGNEPVTLILGDNIFYGHGLTSLLKKAISLIEGATIFGYYVKDPYRFGVVEFNDRKEVINLEEKPAQPKSNYAVTGLYVYDHRVVDIAKKVKPSEKGELDITDVNKAYLELGDLHVELLGNGYSWFDTGTHTSLYQAGQFIEETEKNEKIKIGCIEEIAFREKLITKSQLMKLALSLEKSEYGQYLKNLSKKIK